MNATTGRAVRAVTKHVVMWNVRGDSKDEKSTAAQLIKKLFEELAGKIPGLYSVEVGLDVSGVDYACDVVLCMEFDSPESLRAYVTHPEHLRIRQILGNIRIARYQVDYVKMVSHQIEHATLA